MTIPASDWDLCRQYRATLEKRTADLKTCAADGKQAVERKTECVGELSGARVDLRACNLENRELYATNEILRADAARRKTGIFWLATGSAATSIAWTAVELFAGTKPELVKVATGAALTLVSGGVVVLAW